MTQPSESDHIGVDEAAGLLDVPPEKVATLVDQGLLEPVEGGEEPRFVRAEVLAVRQMGG